MVRANRRITLEEIEDGLNEDCSHFSVHKIVSETLGYRKVSARGVKNALSLNEIDITDRLRRDAVFQPRGGRHRGPRGGIQDVADGEQGAAKSERIHISPEWSNYLIEAAGKDRASKLSNIRMKIKKH
ncbi:hypothetical protein LAZ67_7001831 [Cordylochernes scorpioides]|uniref:Uncharacterized protein n=1 Tax=Cordylochernes scorpioides TaxID=51811 RepID=A0ABY6KPJ5_9ARAC|nr:hypothetical protein LAZ67_7001831 [Cordylochernes scorpioides]